MENRAKKAGIAVCISIIVIGVISLTIYLGGFGPRIANLFKDEQPTEETTYTQAVYVTNASGPLGGMSAVRLEKGTDVNEITDAYNAVSDIAEWGFNTVIFSGYDFSEAAQLATQAKNNGLFSVYMVNSDVIVKSGIADKTSASSISGIGVDSVLIVPTQGAAQNETALAAKTLRDIDDSLYIGVFAVAQKNYSTVCDADVFDYKYIDISIATSSVAGEYSDFLAQYCDGTTKDTVFGMHTEFVGNVAGYEKPDEIMNQFAAATDLSAGYSFYRYSILAKNSNGLRDAILDYMKNGILKDFFKELVISTPSKTNFETNQSKVSFVGTGDITKPLTINGQAVQMVEDGYFSVEYTLKAGVNTFNFEHAGKKVTYTVNYKLKLIESVSPKGNVTAPGGASLEVVTVAHKSAAVKATLNGKTINLSKSDEYSDSDDSIVDDGSDYTYFVGSFTLPESGAAERSIGSVKVTATYQGLTESVTGASVSINAKPTFTPPVTEIVTTTVPPTTTIPATEPPKDVSSTQSGTSETVVTKPISTTTQKPTTATNVQLFTLLTPYKNNGVSGKSKMVVIKNDYSETFPDTTMNDVSVPYFTSLPKGTIDYVTSTCTCDGFNYYVLASGRRVYQSDVEYLSSGYNMPSNEIRTVGVKEESDETKITLTMRWKVPFNVREYPQEYYTQTSGRPYSVKSFTAEYIDIVFYHTSKTDSAPKINTSVISKAQWIQSDSSKATLRIFLKKKGGFYGIKYYYNDDGTLTLSIKERANSAISGKVIMLDPGHGGNDPGAIGVAIVGNKNIYEETINMAIANKVKSKLEALGATVIMTRTSSSKTMDLDTRAALCRAKNPDVFVSIHCDASSSSSSISGTTAYYFKSYSYPLAKYLNESIVSVYKNDIYADNKTMAGNAGSKGTKFKGFFVTRLEECPSVLIEYGFVTNVTECNALAKDKNQNALAQATVDGLVNYFKNT